MLRDGILAERSDAVVVIKDGLAAMGGLISRVVGLEAPMRNPRLLWLFDFEYWLLARFGPTRRAIARLGTFIGGRELLRAVAVERPDVVVSTYPGVTEVLGRLRAAGRLDVPLCSAITDIAALRFWAHPGVDLHLVTHEESIEEVRSIAPRSRVVWARGMTAPDFEHPFDQAEARRALELPPDGGIVLVSGGGWGVGDVDGAIAAALGTPGVGTVLVLCGRNDELRERIAQRHGADARVRGLGFTTRMPELMAAADVLVHSTAGLTVLEAWIRGCRPISYGWGIAHIRANNVAFARHGIADVVTDARALPAAIERALAAPRRPFDGYGRLPASAGLVLELAAGPHGDGGRAG